MLELASERIFVPLTVGGGICAYVVRTYSISLCEKATRFVSAPEMWWVVFNMYHAFYCCRRTQMVQSTLQLMLLLSISVQELTRYVIHYGCVAQLSLGSFFHETCNKSHTHLLYIGIHWQWCRLFCCWVYQNWKENRRDIHWANQRTLRKVEVNVPFFLVVWQRFWTRYNIVYLSELLFKWLIR